MRKREMRNLLAKKVMGWVRLRDASTGLHFYATEKRKRAAALESAIRALTRDLRELAEDAENRLPGDRRTIEYCRTCADEILTLMDLLDELEG